MNNKQKKVRFAVAGTMKWSGKKDIFSIISRGKLLVMQSSRIKST
jgi:hypothetical protein